MHERRNFQVALNYRVAPLIRNKHRNSFSQGFCTCPAVSALCPEFDFGKSSVELTFSKKAWTPTTEKSRAVAAATAADCAVCMRACASSGGGEYRPPAIQNASTATIKMRTVDLILTANAKMNTWQERMREKKSGVQ
eukprot:6194398-Pleurochrysis_carterae.AAC.3